jgi:hypothetical protein
VRLSRRTFLAVSGSAVVATSWAGVTPPDAEAVIVEPASTGPMPESGVGYARAAAALGLVSRRRPYGDNGGRLPQGGLVIAPEATRVTPAMARRFVEAAWGGAQVVIETAGAFADAAATARHDLSAGFGIRAGAPVRLWPAAGRRRVPYVDFTWPMVAKIRDFSRVVPLSAPGWRVAATVDGMPVALARRVGRGTLTVLGSPVGPALAYDDREALAWLSSLAGLRRA